MAGALDVKVGDEVVVCNAHRQYYKIAPVSRITPSGLIDVGAQRFNRDGWERGKEVQP